MKRIILMMACGFCLLQAIFSQKLSLPEGADYQPPLDIPLFLAGNYGELRPNHFHAGLDFKTQGTIGLPVLSFADGYVHRVGINAYGYGLVMYVRHPQLGVTSVYAHLNEFAEPILNKVRAKQVELEENNATITFAEGEIPVTKGMLLAKSGNTGSSGGPHLHFELRDCNDEDDSFFDPLPLFVDSIRDTTAPRIQQVYVYPIQGTVMGVNARQQAGIVRQPDGRYNPTKRFRAWGRIGLGIKAYDYMDGQANIYGVKTVKLFLGDSLIYHFEENCFRYSERRYTNALIDYDAWYRLRSTIMKSFIDPGNHLQMLDFSLGDGTVLIDEERSYPFRYELSDAFGNTTILAFSIQGSPTPMPAKKARNGFSFMPGRDLSIDTLGCRLTFPSDAFYTEADIVVRKKNVVKEGQPARLALQIGHQSIPVHNFYDLSMQVPFEILDTLRNTNQLYIHNLDGNFIGGKYEKGWLNASVREFGQFVINIDRWSPNASFQRLTYNSARLSLSDRGSGIASFKVWIDDKFVPFDMDNQGRYLSSPRHYGIEKGKQHSIRIWVVDRCGNENTIETTKYF